MAALGKPLYRWLFAGRKTTFNMKNNDQLYSKRMSLVSDLRALDADIGTGKPSAEEVRTANRLNEAITSLDNEIKANIESSERAQFSDKLAAITGVPSGAGADAGNSAVMADLLGAGTRGATRSLELSARGIVDENRSILTTTSGATVEIDFVNELVSALTNGSPIWEASRRIKTDHSRTIQFPKMAHGSAAMVSEAGSIAESDPTLSVLELGHYKFAQAMSVSREGEDAVVSALEIVMRDMLTNVGTAAETQLVLGDGTTEPLGIANAGYSASVLGSTGAPTGDELIAALHSVAPQYRRAGKMTWIFNDATIASIRSLKSSDGIYLWQGALTGAEPDRLLGYPVIASSDVAAVGSSAKCGYFIDLDKFVVRETPVRLERSDDYAFLQDVSTWRCLVGIDSVCTDTASGVVLTNAA